MTLISGDSISVAFAPLSLWFVCCQPVLPSLLAATPQFLVEKPENFGSILCRHILRHFVAVVTYSDFKKIHNV